MHSIECMIAIRTGLHVALKGQCMRKPFMCNLNEFDAQILVWLVALAGNNHSVGDCSLQAVFIIIIIIIYTIVSWASTHVPHFKVSM